jgi:hypothetical protein
MGYDYTKCTAAALMKWIAYAVTFVIMTLCRFLLAGILIAGNTAAATGIGS